MSLIMGEFNYRYSRKWGKYLISYQINIFHFFRFLAFDNVRIPREYLMNKNCDVTVDGQYVSAYKDPRKRFAASLGALSNGRVGITDMSVVNLKSCLSIAIRLVYCIAVTVMYSINKV